MIRMTRRAGESGQVLTEYVMMLIIAVLVGWGILSLCRTIYNESNDTVELVSGDVP
jgi:hypothetical protein